VPSKDPVAPPPSRHAASPSPVRWLRLRLKKEVFDASEEKSL